MSAPINHTLQFAGGTDKGKVRQQNEDSIVYCDFEHSDVVLLIVADGVGGHEGGAVASKLAVEHIKENINKAVMLANSGGGYADNWLEATLHLAITEANQVIMQQQLEQPQYNNMATTVVAVLIKEQQAVLSHLGDSRCYHYANNKLTQLTEDHSILQKLLNEGKINHQQFQDMPLHHVISQALGLIEEAEVYVKKIDFPEDSVFLLCSDGLTNCLSDAQIADTLENIPQLEDCVDELITLANDNGGTDNISVVLVRHLVEIVDS